LNFYSDYVNGTDTTGATDGLAPGTSAFQTANHCLYLMDDQIDFDALGQTQATCNMAPATADLRGLHLAFHDLFGAQGGAAFQLVGASLSISAAVSNGGLCEITVPSTVTFSSNEIVSVYGIGGATGCNGTWKVTVTDGTHLTLQSTTFGGAYTSGGTVTNGSVISATNTQALQCFFSSNIEVANVFFQSTRQSLIRRLVVMFCSVEEMFSAERQMERSFRSTLTPNFILREILESPAVREMRRFKSCQMGFSQAMPQAT